MSITYKYEDNLQIVQVGLDKPMVLTNQKTIFVKTFGCSLNQSDSEVMCGLLRDNGFRVITEVSEDGKLNNMPSDVDLVIINTCTVKNLAESKFFRELRAWKDEGVKIVVAGCIPQAEPELLNGKLKDVSVVGTRQIVHIVDIVNDTLNGLVTQNIANDLNERLNLPKSRKNGIVEILPISEGCLSNCTYCKTKLARGNLLSYPKEKIISQFKSALADGCKEFWLTSQDNGCYGFDIYRKEKYFLPELLNDLAALPGDFRIRVGMANPDHIDRVKKGLVESFKNPKIFKFLHIPIQSGNDRVLKDMKRYYTVAEFKGIIDLFKKEIPDVVISTDIIVGFPEESESEFEDTLNLISDVGFEVLNYSRFWLRKGTDAEKMKQLPSEVIKARGEVIKEKFNSLLSGYNKKYVGRNYSGVLIDELSKDGTVIGRNEYYKQILIQNPEDRLKLGDFVDVKIVGVNKYSLVGEIV
ncbi:MAG TPA: tRNA (N(6)-L-threonylcarbamoyladenosine(37)-C(2))-methylthiotransferase [Alphaproteobacteria bacterium]|nr:tRNA (N(6)-L-threonylcarbamoyladenosine(37)-C(2))-methylthiotransferase [Alphaproteobacteria bacterium]